MDGDDIPVRDSEGHFNSKEAFTQRAARERNLITKFSRNDLEDKYLRQYEENLILKKHARKQDEKIKKMATKILRLVGDKKRAEQNQGVKRVRDIETEEMLEELHGKIRDLDKQNQHLKEKLLVAKQQVMTQNKRTTPYNHVQSRINTGIAKTFDPRLTKNMRVSGPPPANRQMAQSPSMPRYGHSLLEEARAEISHLEMELEQQNERMNMANLTIDELKEQMQIREEEFEDDLLKIKQQMNVGQRATVQENIDIIRLQREVKEKSTKLTALQSQYQGLEEKLREVKMSHNNLLQELETSNQQLKHEQSRTLTLGNELKAGSSAQRRVAELQERIVDLERECDIVKEANEKLVNSAFDLEREREWRMRENALKVQIAQLEATLKADVGEKGSILDKLTDERDTHEKLHDEHREMRIQYYQMKQEHDELKEKMSFFTQESAVDFQEIEEALMLVKQKKQQTGDQLDFLHDVDSEQQKDTGKLIRDLQAEHAETINELEKTRNMLIVQHKINSNYHLEVEAVSGKMEENRLEYESRLEEYAQLLDIRAARIRKLEAQLRDVAYGTRQHRLRTDTEGDADSDVDDLQDTIKLERDQNLFEIHIKRVNLSPEGTKLLGDDEPAMFATWEFYEFETQSTPVMKGNKLEYQFTSQYLIKVDDFFLHYIQKDSTTVELHQSFGTDYRTVAVCQLSMKEILERSHGRLHGTVQLTGVDFEGEGQGANLGTLEFWIRLRVPMEQAMRCYKERSKALGYIATNQRMGQQALEAMDEDVMRRPPDNVNELEVKVNKCLKITARRDGIQPSPYVVYKFFDFTDHDTSIVPSSNNPQFNDHKTYPVPMTADLDKYLKTYPLQLYVFDDTDPDEASYIGLANIPLIQLAHDKQVKGAFELLNMEGQVNGAVEVHMKWRYMYIPPKISAKTKEQLAALSGPELEPLSGPELLPGEDEAMRETVVASDPGFSAQPPGTYPGHVAKNVAMTPVKQPRKAPRSMSTPMSKTAPHAADVSNMPELSYSSNEPSMVRSTQSGYDTAVSRSVVISDTIREESEPEGSVLSEGSHVDGESDIMSSSADSTPRDYSPMPSPRCSLTSELTAEFISSLRGTYSRKPFFLRHKRHTAEEREKTAEELIAEELGETVEQDDGNMTGGQDTMFGDEEGSEVNEYDESEVELSATQRSEDTEGGTTDSDVIVAKSPHVRPTSVQGVNGNPDIVRVVISSLSLNENADYILTNDSIKLLFVEFGWPGVSREDTETISLPKPKIGHHSSYNFQKVIHVDFDKNIDARRWLAVMMSDTEDGHDIVHFTIVTEPDSSQEDDNSESCDDIGVARISIPEILKSGKDILEEDIPVYSTQYEDLEIGTVKLTVECLAALQMIQMEME